MLVPGLYEMNYRGLTFRECRRLGGGLLGFVVALVFKAQARKGNQMWLPACDSEGPCDAADLSEDCRQCLDPFVSRLPGLGYRRGAYIRVHRPDPASGAKDQGGYRALHDDGARVMFRAHLHMVVGKGEDAIVTHKVTASGEIFFADQSTLTVCDHTAFLDAGPQHKTVVLAQGDLATVATHLEALVAASKTPAQIHSSLDAFLSAQRAVDTSIWESRVRRGLYRPLGVASDA